MVDVEKILRKSLEKIAIELDYNDPEFKSSKVSTEGANYTSYLFEATISADGRDDLNLFAKVAATGEKLRAMTPMKMFYIEHLFYTEILQEYRQLEEKHGLQGRHQLKVPKLYECDPTLYEETFVMENLAKQGYTLHDRFVSVDWDYAAAAFTELAKFHALSIALRKEKPEYFEKLSKDFMIEMDGKEVTMQGFIENGIKMALASIRDENKGKLMEFMQNSFTLEGIMKYYMPGDRPVIRHGDFRPSNLLSKTNEDGSVDLIPVDYQMLACGTPVVDLFFFIFLGTDKSFREKYFEKLLNHYYTELSAAIARLGMDPENTYSRQHFDDDVKESISYGLFVALTTLALVTVESVDAPEVHQDMDISSFQALKANSKFSDRLNGIIDDFIQWKIL